MAGRGGAKYSLFRFNEKDGCLKTPSKYGIVVINKGLFTDGCKKD